LTQPRPDSNQPATMRPVPLAIVGIGCMFPKANDLTQYWSNIRRGVDAISEVPTDTHWNPADYFDADKSAPDMTYAQRGGFIDPVDFDPLFYGISPNNIEATDTTQLLGMVATHKALRDAGYETGNGVGDGRPFNRDRCSAIVGVTGTLELVIPLGARLGHPLWRKALRDSGVDDATANEVVERIADGYVPWQENSFPGLLGNVAAGRIANRFDLGGTNCVVDAACASSLSAIHMAAMELYAGRSDMAITGGLDTFNDIFMYMCFSKTPALSPTGNSKPFSANGDGTILGEGLGVLVLKRLDDAKRDGDKVYAVIKSIGSSSDGRGNAIYAPSDKGQIKALRNAYETAGVKPSTIELVEAHGTGTKVGDAIEVKALSEVYRQDKPEGTWCAVGSVKSMVGHTKAAAGAAGLIKAAMALHHRVLPPTIKVDEPLEAVQPFAAPVYVNTEARPWVASESHPRRAALSAFGFGGSNFHCVLEEVDSADVTPEWDGRTLLFAFSGENKQAIQQQLSKLDASADWATLRHEAKQWRDAFKADAPSRLAFVVEQDKTDLPRLLEQINKQLANDKPQWSIPGAFYGSGAAGKLGILFPGQGSQRVGMLRDLTCQFPQALSALQSANAEYGQAEHGNRLSDRIYPVPVFTDEARQANEQKLRDTRTAQPAIGATSAGAWQLLQSFGIHADAFAGHSFGELTALWAGGAYDQKTLHHLANQRGQLMAAGDGDRGSMLAVLAPIADVQRIIESEKLNVVIANHNSPTQIVLSGSTDAITQAEQAFTQNNLRAKRLEVSAAFHSELVAGAAEPFGNVLDGVTFNSVSVPVYANTTGQPYPGDASESRQLLANQLAKPVQFVELIENMYAAGVRTFVEVGPGATLAGLTGSILDGKDIAVTALDNSRGKRSGQFDLACVLAQIAVGGHAIDLSQFDQDAPAVETSRKPAMTVKLSGANYMKPREQRPPSPPRTAQPQTTKPQPEAPSTPTPAPKMNTNQPQQTMPTNNPALSQALQSTQQSILALQKMQEQTAQLHRQYLQGQEAAHQTIQQLILQQQQLLGQNLGVTPAQPQPVAFTPAPVAPPPAQPTPAPQPMAAAPTPAPAPAPEPVAAPVPEPVQPQVSKPAVDASRFTDALLEVVAEKTGYPAEMLELDMSLDADLGIDSIKRVEILSALQQRLPDAPPVKPEDLGALQTLRQIVDFMADADQSAPAATPAPVPVATPAIDASKFTDALLEVVAEKTGYPAEMLELDMSLDADLGIDSIKRVEILSALQQRLPDAPPVKPEDLGALQTLRQIVDFMASSAGEETAVIPATTGIDATKFTDALLEVVAEKTGYPAEMLELDMSLDADLGIDSIKRVEILSALQQRLPDAPPVKPEDLGSLQTLRQIVDFMTTAADTAAPTPPVAVASSVKSSEVVAEQNQPHQELLERHLPTLTPLSDDDTHPAMRLPDNAVIWISDDGAGLAQLVGQTLKTQNINYNIVSVNDRPDAAGQIVAGLLILSPTSADEAYIRQAFGLMQHAGQHLRKAAEQGDAFLATASRMGGRFGLGDQTPRNALTGSLAGLSKTASHEWTSIHCKAIDLPAEPDNGTDLAKQIVDQLLTVGPLEVGLNHDGAAQVSLVDQSFDNNTIANAPLSKADVVLVSGGARGVTASVAIAIAKAYGCTLALLGRSDEPTQQPAWLDGLTDEVQIKQAILAHAGNGKPLTPKQVQAEYNRIKANQQIAQTLEQIEHVGGKAVYRQVDVRDEQAVKACVTDLRNTLGPIRGLIHGAGVLADKLIDDKTDEQFEQVFTTKVGGFEALLAATADDELRTMVAFSSSTGRFGRRGQVDYAAANEALNKLSQQQARLRPTCRVLSINWGPWDGGMVTPQLKEVFASEGVGVIGLQAGAEYLVDEMATPSANNAPVEIVIVGKLPQTASTKTKDNGTYSLAIEHELSVEAIPMLKSHVMDGKAVLPMAMIIEWLAHGAMHDNPGLRFIGFEDLRLFKGVTLDADQKLALQVLAAPAQMNGDIDTVPVQLKCGDILHAQANILLGMTHPTATASNLATINGSYPHQDDAIYANGRLFHGGALQLITTIDACATEGIVARAKQTPAPADWMAKPLRSSWLADPGAIDSAFQAMILWSWQLKGVANLPTGAKQYLQYSDAFPAGECRIHANVTHATDSSATADITFLDEQNQPVAELRGFECTISPSLAKAFAANELTQHVKS